MGVFIHALDMKTIPVLSSLFRRIAFAVDGGFIPAEELAEVLEADNRANLLIGGFVNKATQTITLWRGNLESLTVPFSAFEKSGDGTEPDFDAFSVIDCGQTVKLGNYEAAVDAILYEYDPEYRRAIFQEAIAGGSLFWRSTSSASLFEVGLEGDHRSAERRPMSRRAPPLAMICNGHSVCRLGLEMPSASSTCVRW